MKTLAGPSTVLSATSFLSEIRAKFCGESHQAFNNSVTSLDLSSVLDATDLILVDNARRHALVVTPCAHFARGFTL